MIVDRFLTKTLTTSGTSDQQPTGVIVDGGSPVDEFDLGLLGGTEDMMVVINVTANTGTSPTMTPYIESDDNTSNSSGTRIWTCPTQLTASNTPGVFEFPMGKCRERYAFFHTGSIGGSGSPGFTFTVHLTPFGTSGRL